MNWSLRSLLSGGQGLRRERNPWVVLRNWLGQAQPDETKLTDSGWYKKL